jgi:hypothetical protein
MLTHSVCTRDIRLIDMDARRGLPRAAATYIRRTLDPFPHGVVKNKNAVGLERRLEECFCGGIIDVLDPFIVVEILDRSRMANERKALAIERKTAGDQTGIRAGVGNFAGACAGVRNGRPWALLLTQQRPARGTRSSSGNVVLSHPFSSCATTIGEAT